MILKKSLRNLDERNPLPLGSYISINEIDDVTGLVTEKMLTYKILNVCGFGGSGILYKACEVSKDYKYEKREICLKEYFPVRDFERDDSWQIIPTTICSYSSDYAQVIKSRAMFEMKSGRNIYNSSKNDDINNQATTINYVGVFHSICIDSKEITVEKSNNIYAEMQYIGENKTLGDLFDLLLTNYKEKKEPSLSRKRYYLLLQSTRDRSLRKGCF